MKEDFDVKIEFIDDTKSVIADLSRCKLVAIPFFDALFKFKKLDFYQQTVPNVDCALDIVRSFHGHDFLAKRWSSNLCYVECLDYFGLEVGRSMYYSITVDPDEFNFFLIMVENMFQSWESVVADDAMVRCIRHNLSAGLDLNMLHPVLITKLKNPQRFVFYKNATQINFVDVDTKRQIKTFDEYYNSHLHLSENDQFLCMFENDQCRIIECSNFKITFLTIDVLMIKKIIFHPDKSHIICEGYNQRKKYLNCYEISTNKKIWSVPFGYILSIIKYSSNGKYLTCVYDYHILVIDATTGAQLQTIDTRVQLLQNELIISPNDAMLLIYSTNRDKKSSAIILNIMTGRLIKEINMKYSERYALFSPNSTSIIFIDEYAIVSTNIETEKIEYRIKMPEHCYADYYSMGFSIKYARFLSGGETLVILSRNNDLFTVDLASQTVKKEYDHNINGYHDLLGYCELNHL